MWLPSLVRFLVTRLTTDWGMGALVPEYLILLFFAYLDQKLSNVDDLWIMCSS